MNYYNEIDPGAAAWLRELIADGQIPAGEVDERSIWDVRPGDLRGFTQCHFFAGIGGWAPALKLAGIPGDREVWTGSCPCQPFSSAGKGSGVTDERHLWPAWFHLIRECRPDLIFGEQVSAAIGHGWLDLVQDDLEGEGYDLAAFVIPACGVGAPHIRQRLWFVSSLENSKTRVGTSNYADMQKMRHRETDNGVSITGENARISEGHNLSAMSQCGSSEMACGEPRTQECRSQSETSGEPRNRTAVCTQPQKTPFSAPSDSGGQAKGCEERDSVRSGGTYIRDSDQSGEHDMRIDGDCSISTYRNGIKRVELCEPRQGGQFERVCIRQYQNSMLGDECRYGHMGAPETERTCCEDARIGDELTRKDELNTHGKDATGIQSLQNEMGSEENSERPPLSAIGSVGAPHIRQRLWFVAHRSGAGLEIEREQPARDQCQAIERSGETGELADSISSERGRRSDDGSLFTNGTQGERDEGASQSERDSGSVIMADSLLPGRPERGSESGNGSFAGSGESYWSNAVWLPCRDGKSRAVEPAPERLAPGLSDSLGFVCDESGQSFVSPLIQKAKSRVPRLKGYGNSIVPQVAAEVIKAWVSIERDASSEEGR